MRLIVSAYLESVSMNKWYREIQASIMVVLWPKESRDLTKIRKRVRLPGRCRFREKESRQDNYQKSSLTLAGKSTASP